MENPDEKLNDSFDFEKDMYLKKKITFKLYLFILLELKQFKN